MRHSVIGFILAIGLVTPHVAQAQAAALAAPRNPVRVRVPDVQPPRAKEVDLGTEASGAPIEIANTTQMLHTMAGPDVSFVPQFVRCDPRTLPRGDEDNDPRSQPRPDTLALGQEGQIVLADTIYFVGTSNGEQCPAIGKTSKLPPHLLDMVR
ncbi:MULTISPECIES: hypothetical protein [unclassified Sphingopyxis]|uniref:hypothetical protein n=1 Tax=unclassified Sphingopyxis TaxID=2614943 RepID=UPI0007363EB0|nr:MULTISPECIES: hypothetical protein [unclassified Sphingopyxis]KTE36529.1 hypothetical protein ATE62_14320 [Sphingopyxis sp. HIX]KTE84515.1 hypothetical protein ATE72_08650 [Sphingopyxis sp. HXXIV]